MTGLRHSGSFLRRHRRFAPEGCDGGLWSAIVIACLLAPHGVSAGPPEELATAEPALMAPFGFRAVEIFKASRSASRLISVDLNGDGLLDLVYPDNSEGTLRLLIQRAPGEPPEEDELPAASQGIVKSSLNEVSSDPRFRVEKFYTEKHIPSVVVGDFDSDGKPDFAYYSDPPELEVVLQSEPWGGRRTRFAIRDGLESPYALDVADLNGDDLDDLILLARGKTYIFYQKPAAAGETGGRLGQPVALHSPAAEVADLEIADLNGDGRPDFIYFDPEKKEAVHVRLQGASGFGPSRTEEVGPLRSWLVAPFRLPAETEPRPSLFCIERTSKRLKLYRWQAPSGRPAAPPSGSPPAHRSLSPAYTISLGSDGDPAKRRHLITDVNGDDRQDLVVSYSEVAQLQVYFQDARGELTRRATYPTLAAVNSLAAADVDGDGIRDIIVGSVEEKALGVSFWKDERLQFPQTVHLGYAPLLMAAAPAADGEAAAGRVFILRVEGGKYEMDLARLSSSGQLTVESTTSMTLRSAPSELRLLDGDGDGLTDVLVVVPYASPTLLVRDGDVEPPAFREVSRDAAMGFGQLSGTAAGALSIVAASSLTPEAGFSAGSDGDSGSDSGGDVFLACRRKYVRALRLDASGRLSVREQFSGRGAGAELQAAQTLQLDDDPALEVVLMDGATREIDILDRSPEGDYVLQHSLKVPQLDLLRLEVEDMNHDDRDDLVVIGRQKVIVFYGRRAEVGLQEVLSYSVEKEKDFGSPQDLTVGDFNADGWLDVVMTTAPRYNLLALSLPGESVKHASDHRDYKKPADALSGRLKMELAFPVFEEKSYMRRGSGHGPRQMTVADVDGDGLDDLVLLIHDRILVYLQDLCSEE